MKDEIIISSKNMNKADFNILREWKKIIEKIYWY